MKKGMIALMFVGCAALGTVTVLLRTSEDKTAPEIRFSEEEITYVQGEDQKELLEGVTAEDNRDGDVSRSLVIEGVYPAAGQQSATVVYVAKDKANNIKKAKRTVNYQPKEDEEGSVAPETREEEQEPTPTAEPTLTPTPTPTEEPLMETSDEEPEESGEEQLPEGSPEITLTQKKVTMKVGESVNRISFVEEIKDDKDDEEFLWGQIQIVGDEFDSDTAGEYEQIYYVIDSDGNKSNEATLTITVQ